jgi:hypothetical protein
MFRKEIIFTICIPTLNRLTICLSLALISILIISAFSARFTSTLPVLPVYAHITKQVGNMKITVGWSDEPPLTGQVNNIIVAVNKTSAGGHESPVIDALADIDVKQKYGSITKSIDFIPSEQAEGLYESKTVPTRVGSYSLIMNGTIQGEKVLNIEIPLDIVESTQKISFPDASTSNVVSSGTQSASNNIGPRLQSIISGMSNDVESSKVDFQTLAKQVTNIQKLVADIKSSVDRSYMISMVAIGAGVAGIVIAAASLSNKKVIGLH